MDIERSTVTVETMNSGELRIFLFGLGILIGVSFVFFITKKVKSIIIKNPIFNRGIVGVIFPSRLASRERIIGKSVKMESSDMDMFSQKSKSFLNIILKI